MSDIRVRFIVPGNGTEIDVPADSATPISRHDGEPGSRALYSWVMDVSSLNLGPENYRGVPPRAEPPPGWRPDPAMAAWQDRPGR